MDRKELKKEATKLRKQGKTYTEIQNILKTFIPKSTLSNWCRDIKLPKEYQDRIQRIVVDNAQRGREIALIVNRTKRKKYLKSVVDRNKYLAPALTNKGTAKVALAMLYLGEGGKHLKTGALMFGNSDPFVISLFLHLLRYCYNIDETKFRGTLQCRADQDTKKLEKFWSKISGIPLSQFYKPNIDPRTKGKLTRKSDYKGVCRVNYFSADIFIELMKIPKIIYSEGP
jgi:hypothetical protein